MAKKVVKKEDKKESQVNRQGALMAKTILRINEHDNSIKGLIEQINKTNDRIDRLVAALSTAKPIKKEY